MILANVQMQRIEVDKFAIGRGVEAKVFFNDGSNKALVFESELKDIEGDAHKVILKIRKYEKNLNSVESPNDGFLDDFVNVVIKEEDKAEDRIKAFLRKIMEKSHQIKGSRMATGYLDLVNQVKGIRMEF